MALLVACGAQDPKAGEAEDAGCAGLDMEGDGRCDREVADWSAEATLNPGEDRANIYQLDQADWWVAREGGLRHALGWPVASTRLLLPYAPMVDVFTDPDDQALRDAMQLLVGFSTEAGLYARMGMSTNPSEGDEPGSPYFVPTPDGMGPGDAMGAAYVQTERGVGLTFGCAVCHAGSLFGRPVIGLSNKQPRPNALFHFSRQALSKRSPQAFQALTGATEGEVQMVAEAVDAPQAVGTLEPVALGLDTPLAQVAGSLARRGTTASSASIDADTVDEALARQGQGLFDATCAECHGSYEKGWDAEDADSLSPEDRLRTTRVVYHARTSPIDVGTDPDRADGMVDLEQLNRLAISQWMQTTVDASGAGYVPPPLDGIWAHWPYFHDNSAASLCDVLSPPAARATFYEQGPADDPVAHFDAACVGSPTGEAIPEDWLADEEAWVDLSARPPQGHDSMLGGIGEPERLALIAFLKTL